VWFDDKEANECVQRYLDDEKKLSQKKRERDIERCILFEIPLGYIPLEHMVIKWELTHKTIQNVIKNVHRLLVRKRDEDTGSSRIISVWEEEPADLALSVWVANEKKTRRAASRKRSRNAGERLKHAFRAVSETIESGLRNQPVFQKMTIPEDVFKRVAEEHRRKQAEFWG
jgi:hypothetical protein